MEQHPDQRPNQRPDQRPDQPRGRHSDPLTDRLSDPFTDPFTDQLSPNAAQLYAAMVGPPPDLDGAGSMWAACARLTPGELGALLPTARRTLADEDAHELARRAAREVVWARTQPSFTAATLTDFYAALAEAPRPTDVCYAAGALLRCAESWDRADLAASAAILVDAVAVKEDHIAGAALAVAAVAGPAVETELAARLRTAYKNSPLRLAELDVILTTGPQERAWFAEDRRFDTVSGAWPPLTRRLEEHPSAAAFTELAHEALRSAASHLAAIHAGEIPYIADKAFTPADTETLRRAARIALRRDEPWAKDLLATLLPQLAVAPTAARTLPSQSACIGLAQAVEAYPTPESVAALDEARRVVRHAGVSKKLDRVLHRAERNLSRRPEVAVRLPDLGYGPDGTRRMPCGPYAAVLTVAEEPTLTWERADGRPLRSLPAAARRDHPEEVAAAREVLRKTRAQIRTLIRGLEGGYLEGTVYRGDRWRAALAEHPVARGVARRLIWEVEHAPGDWRAVLPAAGSPDDAAPTPSAAVRLWHPARATDTERRRWRDTLTDLRVRQPFRQAFREHYLPGEPDDTAVARPSARAWSTAMFRGHLVRIETVLGVAARQGWTIEDDELVLDLPEVKVLFGIAGKLYPGATGWAEAQDVRFVPTEGGSEPLTAADPVGRSEVLRSVDLLISAASFAWGDTHPHDHDSWRESNRLYDLPLGQSACVRRSALQRILADHLATGRVTLGARHLHLDGHAIHLATGRVTRDGDPVEVSLPEGRRARPLPFLPYDEKLLERIVGTTEELLSKAEEPPMEGT